MSIAAIVQNSLTLHSKCYVLEPTHVFIAKERLCIRLLMDGKSVLRFDAQVAIDLETHVEYLI